MNPFGRAAGIPADVISGLRALPGLASDIAKIAAATEALPEVRQATKDMERHTRVLEHVVDHTAALPAVTASLEKVGEGMQVLRPMDERMKNIEAAMPVLVEVQQHLAQLPETMHALDETLTDMSQNLRALLTALEQLSTDLTTLEGSVGPLGRLAGRFPGGRRNADAEAGEDGAPPPDAAERATDGPPPPS